MNVKTNDLKPGVFPEDLDWEWEKERLRLRGGQIEAATVQECIDKCRQFLGEVHSIVRTETDKWAQEFQKFLLELERNFRK